MYTGVTIEENIKFKRWPAVHHISWGRSLRKEIFTLEQERVKDLIIQQALAQVLKRKGEGKFFICSGDKWNDNFVYVFFKISTKAENC